MSARHLLRRLGQPFRPLIAAGFGLSVLASLSNLLLLAVAGWFLAATAVAGLNGQASRAAFNLVLPAACVRLLAMTRILARYGERLLTHDLALRQNGIAQGWLFRRLARIGSVRLAGYRSGDLLHRCVADSETLGRGWLDVLLPVGTAALVSVVTVGIAVSFDERSALLLGTGLTIMGIIWPVWLARRQQGDSEKRDHARADGQAALIGVTQSCETLLIEHGETALREAILRSTGPVAARASRLAGRQAGFETLLAVVACLTAAVIALLGGTRFHTGVEAAFLPMLTLGALAAFDVLMPLGAACSALARVRGAAERLLNMEAPTKSERAQALPTAPEIVMLTAVTIRYPGRADPVLDGASLILRRGETAVITGPSGSGKSTLLAAIMGQVAPETGQIRLDGRDAAAWDTRARSAAIAAAPQRFHLFHDTLRANMRLASPGATDEDIWLALDRAQIGEAVRAWPDGLGTMLGESGARLSGGEARRIAVAQAILRATPWLILDEGTAGLDAVTEQRLLDALETLPHRPTLLHLAHRRAPLARARRVFRMERGRIVPCRPP